eukprot:TRINITY_DN13589_c2_g1_i1.p1 TRINITY_DN13589_c2_g1~~TRINITY_DN13589_c2_g1_i1.p1  ORF type:complete len:705 (+),score=211.95 TRINITY_DN13589_c2_g1_i1:1533-3647(+)
MRPAESADSLSETGRFTKWLPGKGPQLRSRVGAAYERVFEGLEPDDGRGDAFWSDLWLMRPDRAHLRACFASVSEQELLGLAPSVGTLVEAAAKCACSVSELPRRRTHAFDTLSCCVRGALGKTGWENTGRDCAAVLCAGGSVDDLFGGLLRAVRDAVAAAHARQTAPGLADVAAAALGFLDSIVLGHPRCGRNTLAEFAVRHLTPPGDLFGPPLAAAVSTAAGVPPTVSLRCLPSLACAATYARFEVSAAEVAWWKFFASESEPLRGLVACCTYVLRGFSRSFLAEQNAVPAASALSRLQGWWSRQHADPTPSHTGPPVLSSVLSALLLLHEIVSHDAAAAVALQGQCNPGVVCSDLNLGSALVPSGGSQPFSALFVELILSCSIAVQATSTKDATTGTAARLALLVCRTLCDRTELLAALHAPCAHRLVLADKRGAGTWAITAVGGDDGDVPAACLLKLLHHFFRVNLRLNFSVDLYDICVGCLGRLLLYQYEEKRPVPGDVMWERVFEGLLHVVSVLTKEAGGGRGGGSTAPAATSPAAARLLRRLSAILRLCCASSPTPFADASVREAFIHELVREKDAVAVAEGLAVSCGSGALSRLPEHHAAVLHDAASSLRSLSTLAFFVHERVSQLCPGTQAPPDDVVTRSVAEFSSAHEAVSRSLSVLPDADRELLREPSKVCAHDASFFHLASSTVAEAQTRDS